MKPRTLSKTLQKAAKTFPAIVVTGPRQSGKTTLLKHLFSKTHQFISLEDPDIRLRAKEDPIAFLEENKAPVIFDEIQYVPELLSYIKTRIDQDRKPGQWLFTGSQNFILMQGVTESLAGRAAILSLLPFSYGERLGVGPKLLEPSGWIKKELKNSKTPSKIDLSEVILRGGYPEMASNSKVDRQLWCNSYISTYLERDVRNLTQVGDLNQFERFLKLCALRTGQILNLSEIARDVGVSVPTAKRWISVLEAGYLIYLLYPFYRNVGKRLIKSPKIYFCDTALSTYLMGIHQRETLINSPNFGALFESFVVCDFLKRFLHRGQMPSLYYLRTRAGLEVDLVLELEQKIHLLEIKSAMTIVPKHSSGLVRLMRDLPDSDSAHLISRAKKSFLISEGVRNWNWRMALQK